MAYGRIEDENVLVGVIPGARARIHDENIFVGIIPGPPHARLHDIFVFVGYTPPPFLLVGSQSPADAVTENPNSGDSSPYESNRDAERGIK